MGQRSQIYVRYETENKRVLFARYFQWNYGERMISRARYTIEWLEAYKGFNYAINEKLVNIIETNFDMIDVVKTSDIIEEYHNARMTKFYGGEFDLTFNDYVFHDDNNDGKLLIDVRNDGIFYAFIDWNNKYIGSGNSYMKWNIDKEWKKPSDYMKQETIDYTVKNIREIRKMAKLMTRDQVKEFLSYNYEADDPTAKEISCFSAIPA